MPFQLCHEAPRNAPSAQLCIKDNLALIIAVGPDSPSAAAQRRMQLHLADHRHIQATVFLEDWSPRKDLYRLSAEDARELRNAPAFGFRAPDRASLEAHLREVIAGADAWVDLMPASSGWVDAYVCASATMQAQAFKKRLVDLAIKPWLAASVAEEEAEADPDENKPVVSSIRARLQSLGIELWTAAEVQERRMGSARNPSAALAKMRAARSVLAVAAGQRWRYPSFQFTEGGGVIPGMKLLMGSLDDTISGWSLLAWLIGENAMLGNRMPWQCLEKDSQRVLEAAHAFFLED